MEVVIRPDPESAAALVARLIQQAIVDRPHLVLGLATGGTMERVYGRLSEIHAEDKLDFSLVRTFNLDEYVGISADNPHSYRHYMNTHLFDWVNVDIRNTYLLDGMAEDLAMACQQYEEAIREFGGIDMQLVGIGADGHIGFNEPLSALQSRTRDKTLTPMTLAHNARYFGGDVANMPKRALTMGVGTILESERLLVLATGAKKAEIVAKAVEGPITSMVTASAVQLHARCTVIVDEAAAAELQGTEYYKWVFENEPAWAPFSNQD